MATGGKVVMSLLFGLNLLLVCSVAYTPGESDQVVHFNEEDLKQDLLKVFWQPAIRKGGNNSELVSLESSGGFKPCKISDPGFSFSYSPDTLRRGGSITVDFSLTPTISMTSGKACVSAKWMFIKKKKCMNFKCEDINAKVGTICPFYRGKRISLRQKTFAIPEWRLMEEINWDFERKITPKITVDIKDNNGRTFLCAEGKVKFNF